MSLTYDIGDEHEQLSIDCVQLNAGLMEMRQLVGKAKVHVIHELATYIKKLKKKQLLTPAKNRTRIGKKILGRLSELRLLKKIGKIRLCKLILANNTTPNEMKKVGQNLSKQDRIVVRLAACPEILSFVCAFRSEHADWPTLVHYLLYKNTSGKWKTREQKRRASKKKGDLPFPLHSELPETEKMELDPPSSIVKFAAFKESHDRELLEVHKKMIADEAAEIKSLSSFPMPLFSEKLPTTSADDDSDTASQTAEDIVSIISRRRGEATVSDSLQIMSDENSTQNKDQNEISQSPSDIKGIVPMMLPTKSSKKSRSRKIKSESPFITERISSQSQNTIASKDSIVGALAQDSIKLKKDDIPIMWKDCVSEEDPSPLLFEDENECPLGDDDMKMVQEFKQKRMNASCKSVSQNLSERSFGGRFHALPESNNSNSGNFSARQFSRNVPTSMPGGSKSHRLPVATSRFGETELHPSWAAKRAQKQAVLLPAGKRTVFSE